MPNWKRGFNGIMNKNPIDLYLIGNHQLPFIGSRNRIYRPLEVQVDWNQWINNQDSRKVNKYNQISYQTHVIQLPPGYMGCWVEILHLEDRFEVSHLGQLICTQMKVPEEHCKVQSPIIRTISSCGTFQYKNHWYTVDYKLVEKSRNTRKRGRQDAPCIPGYYIVKAFIREINVLIIIFLSLLIKCPKIGMLWKNDLWDGDTN